MKIPLLYGYVVLNPNEQCYETSIAKDNLLTGLLDNGFPALILIVDISWGAAYIIIIKISIKLKYFINEHKIKIS